MAEHRLMRRVDEVAERLQRVRRLRFRSFVWMLLAFAGFGLLAANGLLGTPALSPLMTAVAGVVLLAIGGLFSLTQRANAHDAARAVEQRYPDLDSRLVTAIAQRPNIDEGGFGFLQHEVISEALLHAQRHDWRDAVPTWAIAGARFRQMAALLMFAVAYAGAAMVAHRSLATPATTPLAGDPDTASTDEYGLIVEPGDVQIERGTALLVLARFGQRLPADVTLVTNHADGVREEMPLSKSLEDPVFGGRVASVTQDMSYHVRFDGRQSDDYRVSVFDYPELRQADATIEYPKYTGMDARHIEDVRRVSVVEGSNLTITCTLNKPVSIARFFADDGTDYGLTPDVHLPNVYAVTWQPQERQSLTLELIDEADRRNKQPPQIIVDVIPNQPPELNVAFPAKDMRVSPLQELPLEANVWDDFGLKEYGLVYQLPGGDEQTLSLGTNAAADAKVQLSHEMSFETIAAQPNELVAYYFYADDIGPTGDLRRSMSNMYFAEVRHFDEIFRQMDSTAGGAQGQQGQAGQPSTQLLQLQRQIVIATWNLVRRENGDPSTRFVDEAQFVEDVSVVADSQTDAIELAGEMQGAIEDAIARQHLSEAVEQMRQAEEHFETIVREGAVPVLKDAQSSAQSAYRSLVKLQARERLVTQQQSSSSSSSSGMQQQLQDQLNQLELKNNRNRYESEQQESPPADQEALQVLNRLRELARRQGDLNEKIQELENELRAAQTDEERKEIERQLRRLQEEQQQLLRDLEEMQERMEKPQNRSRMAEARQQVEQTREHLRQTKESLQQGQVSKALAEGTRAQRELEDLKNQFRDETASQFADTMRELRDDVRELADQEEKLSDQLAGRQPAGEEAEPNDARPRLRDETPDGKDLQQAVEEQQEKLADIMREAEDIVRQSEFTEPLLSKKLYDAVRNTRVDQPEQSLAMTNQFLKLGLKREAAQAEQQAKRGIDKLRGGVEEAAESVLGNEIASLERARKEVDELSNAIASELAQADPEFAEEMKQAAEQAGRAGPSQNEEPSDQSQAGESPDERRQRPGDRENEDPDQPQRSPGQNPGERQQGESAQQGQQSRQGQQPGKGQQGQQPGENEGGGQQPSENQQAQAEGGQGLRQGRSDQTSSQPGRGQGDSQQDSLLSAFLQRSGNDGRGNSGPHLGPQGPLTSGEFVKWSDRMRDVEEMLDEPELRAEVARIRDEARQMRIDVNRHSKAPDWKLVRLEIYGPMLELQDRLAEEIARLQPDSEEIVPLDRDPVPDRYAELVRRYYERLGSGR